MSEKYYHTKVSVEEYIQLAKDVNGLELIEKFRIFLKPGANLLEIGTGPGTDWRILSKKYNVTGSDSSREFLSYLQSNNPAGKFLELDAATLLTNKRFDGIYSNKVLHHLNDNELSESIKRQHAILNSDGIICHSFWKGEGSEYFKGMFVNYHNKIELKKLFESFFDILLLEYYQEFEQEDSILLIAKKKLQQ